MAWLKPCPSESTSSKNARCATKHLCGYGLAALLCAASLPAQATGTSTSTLDKVRTRGALLCGIDRSEAEYSSTDEHGNRAAFDRDLCRAVAVAVLGRDAHTSVTYYADDATSMDALVNGKADMIATLSVRTHPVNAEGEPRDIRFSQPVLNDAVGLMVLRASGITRAEQLSGRKICYLTETDTETKLQQWFTAHGLDLLPFPFQEEGEMEAAFVTDNCAALGGDLTRLAQTRASTGTQADEFVILRQTFGADTLAVAYRADDAHWANLIDRVLNILFQGKNIAAGERTDLSQLRPGWAADVLASVGTYTQIFERDLGDSSVLKLDRATLQPPAAVRDAK